MKEALAIAAAILAVGLFAVGLRMLLNAASTLIKYQQLAKMAPPERSWRDRIREPRTR